MLEEFNYHIDNFLKGLDLLEVLIEKLYGKR